MQKIFFLIFAALVFVLFSFASSQAKECWMVMDSSGSLSENQARLRNESALGYAQYLLLMNKSNLVGVMDFAEDIQILKPTDNLQKIRAFINRMDNSGRLTDLETALKYFTDKAPGIKCNLYIFTDGQPDVAPSRCPSCSPTSEDLQSINRIKDQIVPPSGPKGLPGN